MPIPMWGSEPRRPVEEQTDPYADARRQGRQAATRASANAAEPQHHQIRMPRTLATRGLQEATWIAYFIDGWRDVRPNRSTNVATARAVASPPTAVQADQERRFGLALVGYANGRYSLVPEPIGRLLGPLGINQHHPRYAQLVQDYDDAHREAAGRDAAQIPPPPPPLPATGWTLFWWIGILDGRNQLSGTGSEGELNSAADFHLSSVFGTYDVLRTSGAPLSSFRDSYRAGYEAGRRQSYRTPRSQAVRRGLSPPSRRSTASGAPGANGITQGTTQNNPRLASPARSATSVASASGSRRAQSASPNRQRTPSSDPRRYGFAALGWQDGYHGYRQLYTTSTDTNPGFIQAIQAFGIPAVGRNSRQSGHLRSQYNNFYDHGRDAGLRYYSGGPPPPPPPHEVAASNFMHRLGQHDRLYYREQPESDAVNVHLGEIYGQIVIPDRRREALVSSYRQGLRTPPPPPYAPPPPQPLRSTQLPEPRQVSRRPSDESRPSSAGSHAGIVQPMPRRVAHPPAIASPGTSRSTSRSSFLNRDLYAGPSPPPPRGSGPTNPPNPSRSSSSSPLMATQQLRTTQMTMIGPGSSPRPTSARSTISRARSDSSLASLVRPGYVYVEVGTQVPPGGVPTRRPQQVQQRRSLPNFQRPALSTTTSQLTTNSEVRRAAFTDRSNGRSALARFIQPVQQPRRRNA